MGKKLEYNLNGHSKRERRDHALQTTVCAFIDICRAGRTTLFGERERVCRMMNVLLVEENILSTYL